MRFLGRLFLFLLTLTAGGLAAVYFMYRGRGFSARAEPPPWEHALAAKLRGLAMPPGARAQKNPVEATPAVMAEAREHYADHCYVCHDEDGSGQTEIGRGLYPKPPDLRGGDTQKLSDGEIFYIIRNGVRFTGMPGFAEVPEAQDRETWALVHLIRRMPAMSAQELEEIERLAPRSREHSAEDEMERFLAGEDPPPEQKEEP